MNSFKKFVNLLYLINTHVTSTTMFLPSYILVCTSSVVFFQDGKVITAICRVGRKVVVC